MNELTYRKAGDYLIPELTIKQEGKPLGKYGRMRKRYLKEHRLILWTQLLLNGTLYPHLQEIDETANRRMALMLPELAKRSGVTEALKARDPMTWVGMMNNLKAQAEEIILNELIFN
ncbi:MAG: TnpV protein [Oscillospiraceae bacterium]|nr:TnpV protein [Oscillospiraceae bacterium]